MLTYLIMYLIGAYLGDRMYLDSDRATDYERELFL
jgi:hypothetical protein